jgi:hypothetical protein
MPALPPSIPSAIGPFVRAVPVVIAVILLAPMWLTCVFLSRERQQFALQMVKALGLWVWGYTPTLEGGTLESGSAKTRQERSGEPPREAKALHRFMRRHLLPGRLGRRSDGHR